jgi:hypothetical protein
MWDPARVLTPSSPLGRPTGHVIGVDMTEEMLRKARATAAALKLD